MSELKYNSTQIKINQVLCDICNAFKLNTNIKKNYIEYISALLYIKYINHFNKNIDINFEIIYKERKNYYITEIIDNELDNLRSKLKNESLFSNIKFKNVSIYRNMGEASFLETIIECIYKLESFIKDNESNKEDIIAKAYEYMLENIVMKDDITKQQKEFYTPSFITNIMASITMQEHTKNVFDPYCGSGNFLLSANQNKKIDTIGIEKELNIYNICMTNLLLHNIDNHNITCKDTIIKEKEKYDVILANPPFAQRNWINAMNAEDISYIFKSGLNATSVADYAYVLSMFNHLRDGGRMAVILPHGVLFRENELYVRRKLIENNCIETIIGLPENIFYGNRMSVIILVVSKNKKDDKVLFVDASKEYINERKNNILTEEMQKDLIDICINRKEVKYRSHLASIDEIGENSFNLTIKRYVKEEAIKKVKEEKRDIIMKLEKLEKEKGIIEENINDVLEALDIQEVFERKREDDNIIIGNIDYERIGNNIKKAREKEKYTQEEMAEKLDMSIAFLSRIERGTSHVNLKRLGQICDILNVPISDILK